MLVLAACGDDEASDEARIEQLLDDVTGKVDSGYVDRVLRHIDVPRYGLDVRVPHHAGVYDEQTAPALLGAFREGMSERFSGDEFDRRSTSIEIEGDRGEVRFGLVTRFGPASVSMTLRRPEPGVWKVARVHVDR